MRDFKEIATRYQFAPVRAAAGNLAGYLHLDGKDTKAVLNSAEFHHLDDKNDENGWFDVELEDQQGSRLLLHNALTQSRSMPGSRRGKPSGSYTTTVFPNIVVCGIENLRSDRTLCQMEFQFEGAENFFVYNTIEWRSFRGQPDQRSVLKTVRDGAWKAPKGLRGRDSTNDIDEIYIIHKPKMYLKIRLEDMKIAVWHARSTHGMGWTGHEIRIKPVISVVFDKPISVGEAIDRVWRIKGFFDQIALCDLKVKAISLSKFKKGWPLAEVYLPHESERVTKGRLDIHPTNVPFSRWAERRRFSAAFENWLTSSKERRFFRAAVRLSLIRLQQEIDPTLTTLLLAGIESLPELRRPSLISKQTISKMAEAAHRVDPSIELAAIRGLLGNLGRTSPKQRLRILSKGYFANAEEVDKFAEASVELRNQIAHGRSLDEVERAAAGDLVRVLAYLCVAYDLQTSGFPTKDEDAEGRRLLAISQMSWTWQGYKMAVAKDSERRRTAPTSQ